MPSDKYLLSHEKLRPQKLALTMMMMIKTTKPKSTKAIETTTATGAEAKTTLTKGMTNRTTTLVTTTC